MTFSCVSKLREKEPHAISGNSGSRRPARKYYFLAPPPPNPGTSAGPVGPGRPDSAGSAAGAVRPARPDSAGRPARPGTAEAAVARRVPWTHVQTGLTLVRYTEKKKQGVRGAIISGSKRGRFPIRILDFHDIMKKSGPTLAGPIIFRQNRGRFLFIRILDFFHDGPVR